MRREQFEEALDKFVPVSETVQKVWLNSNPQYKELVSKNGFKGLVYDLADSATDGDRLSMIDLLDLIKTSERNEGLLEGMFR